MKTLIIQTSPYHTASTFLVNALYGIIPELFDKKIIGEWVKEWETYFEDIIVIKSHELNIDNFIKKYSKTYRLFFICSERQKLNYRIDEKYKKYNNVIVFDFDELNETNEKSIVQIVDNIYFKMTNLIKDLELDKEKCIKRIELMNNRYKEIKEKPFTYIDDFFELHGSHRNRKNNH
jgi:hypothetical protein